MELNTFTNFFDNKAHAKFIDVIKKLHAKISAIIVEKLNELKSSTKMIEKWSNEKWLWQTNIQRLKLVLPLNKNWIWKVLLFKGKVD